MTSEDIEDVVPEMQRFLEAEIGVPVSPDQDLFATGLVSSMFALRLIVHLEGTFGVSIVGKDLKLDNFRTITAMAALVSRLRFASQV